jgi:hypothetical protein
MSHYGPGLDSASNINEYQEYFLGVKGAWCVGLTTLAPSCADFLEISERRHPGKLGASPDLCRDCFIFSIIIIIIIIIIKVISHGIPLFYISS